VLLDFGAPGASFACWRGQEHGRTIPLPDIDGSGIPQRSSLPAVPRCAIVDGEALDRAHLDFRIPWPAHEVIR
jgi:hypothetical protein